MAITSWATLVRDCLLNRVLPEEWLAIVRLKSLANPRSLIAAILHARQSYCLRHDPLPGRYLEVLFLSHQIRVSDFLLVLVHKWDAQVDSEKLRVSDGDVTSLQELIVLLMSRLNVDSSETRKCLLISSRWLAALVQVLSQSSESSNGPITEVVGSLFTTLSATTVGTGILSEKEDTGSKRPSLSVAVRNCLDQILSTFPALSVQLIERLSAIRKHVAIFEQDLQEHSSMHTLQIQASILETPMTATRAGTVLYIESMISKTRTIDDTILFNFLAGRHNNNWQSMFSDILFGCFSVLRRSQTGSKDHPHSHQADILIRNKLPSILTTISGSSFGLVASEQTIVSAWDEIKGDLKSPQLLHCAGSFLLVCSFHHLISLEVAKELSEEELSSSKGLVAKEDLLAQANSNPARLNKLADELVHTDGSAASISQAVVELIGTYAQSKETHYLRDLANAFVKSPQAIDALAMFVRPSYWLSPLCTLLDEWRWDEIHGESQPVYEEFGSILLLVVAAKKRLRLSLSDLGVQDGFVAQYFGHEGIEIPAPSEELLKHLGDWIYAMFIAEGLSDEVTTTCSPQQFYILIPNLLRQASMAHQKGKLSLDALRDGVNCKFHTMLP
jgi:mediator of RNA polymerase II transcription subunit 5